MEKCEESPKKGIFRVEWTARKKLSQVVIVVVVEVVYSLNMLSKYTFIILTVLNIMHGYLNSNIENTTNVDYCGIIPKS